jgi:DNA topoisomerase-1
MILAGIGRYGPYVQHNGTYANLPTAEEVFDVGLNRAIAVLAEKRAGGGRPQRGATAALKELGAHPGDGQPVRVLSGRYGPYIKHGATNANVPKGADPAALTMDEAVALLAARQGAGGGKARKAKPSPRTTNIVKAKKTSTKRKPAAKKKAAS